MGLMQRRRELLAMQTHKLDTSPIIDEYGKYWSRTIGLTVLNDEWCITKFYAVDDPYTGKSRNTYINGFVGADTTSNTFQYHLTNGSSITADYWYFAGTNPRKLLGSDSRLTDVSFSIQISELDNSYAFFVETGQILFAGKNTPYYGYTNINDMPTA